MSLLATIGTFWLIAIVGLAVALLNRRPRPAMRVRLSRWVMRHQRPGRHQPAREHPMHNPEWQPTARLFVTYPTDLFPAKR